MFEKAIAALKAAEETLVSEAEALAGYARSGVLGDIVLEVNKARTLLEGSDPGPVPEPEAVPEPSPPDAPAVTPEAAPAFFGTPAPEADPGEGAPTPLEEPVEVGGAE